MKEEDDYKSEKTNVVEDKEDKEKEDHNRVEEEDSEWICLQWTNFAMGAWAGMGSHVVEQHSNDSHDDTFKLQIQMWTSVEIVCP